MSSERIKKEDIIGYVIGESDIQQTTILLKQKNIVIGQYIILEYLDKKVLGLIIAVNTGSPVFNNVYDIKMIEDIIEVDKDLLIYTKAKVKLLYDLNNLTLPDQPPLPLAPVRLATDRELERFSAIGNIRLGKLIGTNAEVRINGNALFRHLAILASTGAGKSNTVAILSSRIAELGGTMLIFDYHDEYYDSDIKKLNQIQPQINPLHLTVSEFAKFINIDSQAHIQYRLFRKAFKNCKDKIREELGSGRISIELLNNGGFLEKFEESLEEVLEKERSDNSKRADEVTDKIEDFMDRYDSVINFAVSDVTERIRKGMVNVVDTGSLVDEQITDTIISHYLRRILQGRKDNKRNGKGGLEFPIITVIEEAHVFLSKNERTLTKTWASAIAREGRKFGVGLIIVSQRPKGIDENILSQMTNKIILRIVEPSDQRYVIDASDNLGEDIANSLPSLNVGEALLIGNLAKIPLMIKIDKFEGKLGGSDPDMFKPNDFSNIEGWEV